MNNSHGITTSSSSTLLTKFICENPSMSLAWSLVWLKPLTQSAAYTWMPILPLWRYALWIIYETVWNNWKRLPWCLLCKSHRGPIQTIAPCRVLIILTQRESHGVTAKRVGPGARWVGSSRYLGVPITRVCKPKISVQGRQFSHMWPFMLDRSEDCKTAANTWYKGFLSKCLMLTSLRADRYKMIQKEHIELEDHPLQKLHRRTPFWPNVWEERCSCQAWWGWESPWDNQRFNQCWNWR